MTICRVFLCDLCEVEFTWDHVIGLYRNDKDQWIVAASESGDKHFCKSCARDIKTELNSRFEVAEKGGE